MKQLDIDLEKIAAEDRASARQREMVVRDKTPTILAYLYSFGYFFILALIIFKVTPIDEKIKDLVNVLLGVLSAAEVGIISYYFGSSSGSAAKSAIIERLAEKK
jgi:hypothetical protein